MINITVDPRDGGAGGVQSCDTCCCDQLKLRPGETDLMRINYAPWTLLLNAAPVHTTTILMELDNDNCSDAVISGFAPPSAPLIMETLVSTAGDTVGVPVSLNLEPATNTFTYELVPLSGPEQGEVVQDSNNASVFHYTSFASAEGWDHFTIRVTDAQGRSIYRIARVSIGLPADHGIPAPGAAVAVEPYIDRSQIVVNEQMHYIEFPITMPLLVQPCEQFRMTIKQPAQDCNKRKFNHISCYDIRRSDCG